MGPSSHENARSLLYRIQLESWALLGLELAMCIMPVYSAEMWLSLLQRRMHFSVLAQWIRMRTQQYQRGAGVRGSNLQIASLTFAFHLKFWCNFWPNYRLQQDRCSILTFPRIYFMQDYQDQDVVYIQLRFTDLPISHRVPFITGSHRKFHLLFQGAVFYSCKSD